MILIIFQVSIATKSKKPAAPSSVSEVIPDFKDFEDYELEVETTMSKTPEREKRDVNLLSPLRENSWENLGKAEVSDAHETDVKEKGESKPALKPELEATKDYLHNQPSTETSSSSPSSSAFHTAAAESSTRGDSHLPRRDVGRPQSSPILGGKVAPPSTRARSWLPRSITSSSTSSPPSQREDDSSASGDLLPRNENSSSSASKEPDPTSSASAESPPSCSMAAPDSSVAQAPSGVESVVDTPPKRTVTFPTPERNGELPDFSRISFCSPLVAGNLTFEEEGPEVASLGLKASHLRRLGALTTSTSTPLQNMKRKIFPPKW